mgnify:CR=1 FL=1
MKIKSRLLGITALVVSGCANLGASNPAPSLESREAERTVIDSGLLICIVNSTPDLLLEILHDGKSLKKGLREGEYFTIRINGNSDREVTSAIIIIARSKNGSLFGVANKTFPVSEEPKSESWIVSREELAALEAKG